MAVSEPTRAAAVYETKPQKSGGGLAKRQGIALMAIGGNILGVGLHSYGFTDSGFVSMVGFVLFNLILICIGSLPEEMWRSFRNFASKSQLKKKDATSVQA